MKKNLLPTTALAPVPVVLITCGDEKINNVMTVAWAGTINSVPPMVSISVRHERFSYPLIKNNKEFTINLTTQDMLKATDLCGVLSGKNCNKFKEANLEIAKGEKVKCPYIVNSPVSLECKVTEEKELGTHTIFFAEIVNVIAEEEYINEKGRLSIPDKLLIAYNNGHYIATGEKLGTYGFSAKKQ